MNKALRRVFTGALGTRALVIGVLLAGSLALPQAAEARVYVGVGIGGGFAEPYYGPPAYPGYPVYAYPPSPPVFYPPPPPAYYGPPVEVPAYGEAPVYNQAPASTGADYPGYSTSDCRPYSSTQIISGAPQELTGTACHQPDGTWRIVQ